ncbi:interleukin 12 receptor, beta 2a, like [Brachyistius frenatus]|uniref:interleukin 12 receptor, beta 2a, like n=1 Tax=Brachyistius frenatus TaxID=100188 RepID=UPI0037E88AE6
MASPKTKWLLSILLVILPNCCAVEGAPAPPSPPSPPECSRQCEKDCSVEIHCIWDKRLDPQNPINYSLHWKPAHHEDGPSTSGTSLGEYIHREHRSNGELRVWVQARNQHGSAKSEDVVFNTEDIIKPPPPKCSSSHEDPFEIYWSNPCHELQKLIGVCDIRHRTAEDRLWPEFEGGLHGSYTFMDPRPCTVYEFQVRCSCDRGRMSDWSAIHRMASEKLAPVGEVDVWVDCGMSPTNFDCFLAWKNLSFSQACGLILAYEVRISYNNGTEELMNVSIAKQSSHFVYDGIKWHLSSSLKDVSSVGVLAYNAVGPTASSCLVMPIKGKAEHDQAIQFKMNEENLTVFWDLPSQFSDSLREYVVQYKDALGREFDWIKVNRTQTTGFFEGHFKRYTPYMVSLFSVSPSGEIRELSSLIGYSLQKAPSTVPSFKVISIAATDVTLFWEPVPLPTQNGHILYYQIGVDTQKVYNVSASPQHKKHTFELLHLSPGQEYQVWIRAVTVAGPGENVTTRFETKHHEDIAFFVPVLTVIVLLVIIVISLLSVYRGENKVCPLMPRCLYVKVPDPSNSHIFRQMKYQNNEPLTWNSFPVYESHTKISVLEVVERKPQPFYSDGSSPVGGDWCSQTDCQNDQKDDAVSEGCGRTDHRCRTEDYSKMVDSDDREDLWSSSEEEQFTLGYEKHFMPTSLEILEV